MLIIKQVDYLSFLFVKKIPLVSYKHQHILMYCHYHLIEQIIEPNNE